MELTKEDLSDMGRVASIAKQALDSLKSYKLELDPSLEFAAIRIGLLVNKELARLAEAKKAELDENAKAEAK